MAGLPATYDAPDSVTVISFWPAVSAHVAEFVPVFVLASVASFMAIHNRTLLHCVADREPVVAPLAVASQKALAVGSTTLITLSVTV